MAKRVRIVNRDTVTVVDIETIPCSKWDVVGQIQVFSPSAPFLKNAQSAGRPTACGRQPAVPSII
jgi:hypothetical protein